MPLTVLLVEDDFGVREALAAVLEDQGFRVVCAYDGRDALGYLDSTRAMRQPMPVLIVTDLNMPRMNGRVFVEQLGHVPDYLRIPIIAISATSPHELSQLQSVVATFDKPIRDWKLFIDTISRAAQRGLAASKEGGAVPRGDQLGDSGGRRR